MPAGFRPNYLCLMKLLLRLVLCVLPLVAASCRTCPLVSCHTRKVHLHSGIKYRGQPWFKKQNPAVGEKINVFNPKSGSHSNDKSKTLK